MGFNLRAIALIFLLSVSVRADVLDSLSHYRTAIRMRLGFSTTSTALTDTLLNTHIRFAAVQVNNEVGGYRVSRSFVTAPFTDSYSFDSTIAPQSITIKKYDTVKSLNYKPMSEWSSVEHQKTTGQANGYLKRPSYYDYIDGRLFIFPAPYLIDTIRVIGVQKVLNAQTAQAITQIPERYRNLVLLLATVYVAQSRQHPMFPLIQGEYQRAIASLVGADGANKATATPR